MREWKDNYFTDVCNSCGKALTIDGLVYVIRDEQGICADCYESIKIYVIDYDVIEKKEKKK